MIIRIVAILISFSFRTFLAKYTAKTDIIGLIETAGCRKFTLIAGSVQFI